MIRAAVTALTRIGFFAFLIFVAPVLVVFGALLVQRKGWIVKLKNLIGGVLVAAAFAVVLTKAPSIYIECSYYPWCWPY